MSIPLPRPMAAAGSALVLAFVTMSLPTSIRAQDGIGIKVGDTVNVATGQGMVLAIVRAANGHEFKVHVINGPEVLKRYPIELRRRGKLTAYDRANGVYDVGDLEQIKKYNAIEIDEHNRITYFEEKPKEPKSTLTGIALYFYPRWVLPLIHQYIADGNNPDQPGRLVQWLYPRVPFYVWKVPGIWFDVGSIETLEEANRVFGRGANG